MTDPNSDNAASPASPRAARSSEALFLLLLLWLLTTAAYKGAVSVGTGITGIDFTIFYHAAQRLASGQPLYQPHGELYAYSPLFAIALRPLAHLSLAGAVKVWFCFSALCLACSVFVYASAARMTLRDASLIGLMLLVGFRCWPTTMNFALGQANLLLLLLLCGMYWADSRARWTIFAVLVAVAALIKIWMLAFLIYLVARRQWRAVALSAVLFAVSMAALFALVGWQEFGPFVQAGLVTGRQVLRISVTHSLYGFALLHLRANSLMTPLVHGKWAFYVFLALGAAAVGYGLALLWNRLPAFGAREARLALGLVAVSVLLLLPPCQNEYLVLCLPALWTLLTLTETRGRHTALLWACGVLVYVMLSRGWAPYAPLPPAYQHGLKSLLVSMNFYALCLLWLATVAALRRTQFAALPASLPGARAGRGRPATDAPTLA